MVTGFHAAALHMNSLDSSVPLDLQIHLSQPKHFVVMTPCCSIEMKSIALAPLEQLRVTFLSYPQLWDNMTRINSKMPAQDAVPPMQWQQFDEKKKAEIIAQGTKWVFLEHFIYEGHDLFEPYTIRKSKEISHEFRCRQVDFKKIFRVDCSQIDKDHDAPAGVKLLQLTEPVRAEMRDKLAYFFGRIPDEDLAALAPL